MDTWYYNVLFPTIVMIMGIGIISIWLLDIISGKFNNCGNIFTWQEGENKLWLHILAEFLTGFGLIISSVGLFTNKLWADELLLIAIGATLYTCINSSGWVIFKKERIKYGIPIWITLIAALIILIFYI